MGESSMSDIRYGLLDDEWRSIQINLIAERNMLLQHANTLAEALRMCLRVEGNLPIATARQANEALDAYIYHYLAAASKPEEK